MWSKKLLLITGYLYLALSASAMAQTQAPKTPEEKALQRINADRKVKHILPCGEEDELSALANQELTAMLEKPELAQTMKQRLKNHRLLKIGFSSLLFAAPNEKAIIAEMAKQKSYQLFMNKELDTIGLAVIKVDSDPPFYQALIIGAKAPPKDPCNGQPGLSEGQINHAKYNIDAQAIACYNKEITKGDPNLRGRIAYSLVVNPDGSVVRNVLFVSEELKPVVFPCIEKLMSNRLSFPKPCGNKPVNVLSFGWDFVPPQGDKRLGRLSKNEITLAVQRRRPQIQKCYEKELKKNKKLAGEMTLKFTINGQGEITKMLVINDTLNNLAVSSCVDEQARKIIFPAPQYNGEVEIEFPLTFAPEK